MHYVYSLKCKDGYYVGCTDNLKERIERHQRGHVLATANRLPLELDFYFALQDKYKAFEFEKYLKSGSGRAFVKNISYKLFLSKLKNPVYPPSGGAGFLFPDIGQTSKKALQFPIFMGSRPM